MIYAYGPVAKIMGRLREKHFAEADAIRVPVRTRTTSTPRWTEKNARCWGTGSG